MKLAPVPSLFSSDKQDSGAMGAAKSITGRNLTEKASPMCMILQEFDPASKYTFYMRERKLREVTGGI